MEFFVRTVEEQRSRPHIDLDVARILAEVQSPDEKTRARGVREICPCRIPMEIFAQLRPLAKQLQHDPSPLVRANALHIEKDLDRVTSFEAQCEAFQEMDADEMDADERRPNKRHTRQRR